MPRVLLADDEPDILLTTSIALRMAGYDVEESADGASALDAVGSEEFDAMLLDLRLPGLSGWEVLERVKSRSETRALTVIVLSAHVSGHSEARALRAGAAAYVTKPFDPKDLVRTLGDALEAPAD